MSTPYQLGYQAVMQHGLDLPDNPFRHGTDSQAFAGWRKGAMKALEENNAVAKRRMDDAAAEASRELGRRGGL